MSTASSSNRGRCAAPRVIAVDGPSGSGKSTVSRALAHQLGARYLDTGAMYRAVTWAALARGVNPADAAALCHLARDLGLEVSTDPERFVVLVDGTDVSTAVRGRDVERAVSAVSAVRGVRAQLVARQRQIAAAGDIVVEGRDIGTVVFPHAAVKVFLTADNAVRAARRTRDAAALAAAQEQQADVRRTRAELDRRDRLDAGRKIDPLRPAADAVTLDSSAMTVDEVVEQIRTLVAALP